jgi:hypothetical protein
VNAEDGVLPQVRRTRIEGYSDGTIAQARLAVTGSASGREQGLAGRNRLRVWWDWVRPIDASRDGRKIKMPIPSEGMFGDPFQDGNRLRFIEKATPAINAQKSWFV